MKSLLKRITLGLVTIVSVFGINIVSSNASIRSDELKIRENTPLYLEHASSIISQSQGNNNLVALHSSHYSHGSHGSHESHVSHYSSRD
jgi:hypothetical protein